MDMSSWIVLTREDMHVLLCPNNDGFSPYIVLDYSGISGAYTLSPTQQTLT